MKLHVAKVVSQDAQHRLHLDLSAFLHKGCEPRIGHAVVPCHKNIVRIRGVNMLGPCDHVGGNGWVGKVGAATRHHKVRGGWLDDGCCTG